MNFAPMQVNVLGFKVNVMDRASTLSLGPIQQVDFYLSTKRNMGFGEQNGDVTSVNVPISYINDVDLLDSNSQKTSNV